MTLFPDATIVFQWLLFMTALVVLHYGIFRPILHRIRERQERGERERRKAEALRRVAEGLLAECEQRIAEAHIQGARERERHLAEGETRVREILTGLKRDIDQEMEDLRNRLDREKRQASLELKQYAQGLGREIAEEILGRRLT